MTTGRARGADTLGHAQGSAGATHVLRVGDEADTADRERTAAVPTGPGARQRRERERDRPRRILRGLGTSEEARNCAIL